MKDYIIINRTCYDELAKQYEMRVEASSQYEEPPEKLGDFALGHLSLNCSRICRVVEIGPGAGKMLEYFESCNCRTIGIELSHEMAKIALKTSPKSIIINDDVFNVNFIEEQFDLVYMSAIIHLFSKCDALELLLKVKRWIKKDGLMFVNTTCCKESEEGIFIKKDYSSEVKRFRRNWVEEDFFTFVTEAGFDIVDVMYTNEIDRDKKWVAYMCCVRK